MLLSYRHANGRPAANAVERLGQFDCEPESRHPWTSISTAFGEIGLACVIEEEKGLFIVRPGR